MKSFNEIKKELKSKGIEIKKTQETINGMRTYKVFGSKIFNEYYLWTAEEIKRQAYEGGF
jgi:hypothetical protein